MKQIIPAGKCCFNCGTENPIGLHLEYYFEDNKVTTVFTPGRNYGISESDLTPGIAFGVLVEAMGLVPVCILHLPTVMAESSVKFFKPVPIGKKITIVAEPISVNRWLSEVQGVILDEDGNVCMKATGKIIVRNQDNDTVNDHFTDDREFYSKEFSLPD